MQCPAPFPCNTMNTITTDVLTLNGEHIEPDYCNDAGRLFICLGFVAETLGINEGWPKQIRVTATTDAPNEAGWREVQTRLSGGHIEWGEPGDDDLRVIYVACEKWLNTLDAVRQSAGFPVGVWVKIEPVQEGAI